MKTDRFSDAIRRKLESIRPEFTDKDWTRMQSTLHQAGFPQPDPGVTHNPFSGGVWSGNAWWLAAASVSTVALIAVGIWQRSEINHLRQTVSQLQQKAPTTQVAPVSPAPERPGTTPVNGTPSVAQTRPSSAAPGLPAEPTLREREQSATIRQRDTVYLDRYVTAPTPSDLDRKPKNTTRQQPNLNLTPKNDTYDVSSTPLSTNKSILNKPNQSVATNGSVNQSVNQRIKSGRLTEKSIQSERYADVSSPIKPANEGVNQSVQTVSQPVPQPQSTVETVNGVSADYESIASRPLSTKSLNWNALLARQVAKRMRPSQPARPATEQAPTAQPESRVDRVALRVRAGVGAEVASHLWGVGVFAEGVIGRHWLLSLGLNQTTYNYTFINDIDFYQRTHRKFPDDFPHVDQRREIQNINAQTTRLQIPAYLGYRIPITKTIAFVPTVGTYLNLNSTEKATYYSSEFYYYSPMFPPPPRKVDEFATSIDRPVALINSLSLGTGIEWQFKHWVAQASPMLTIPFQAQLEPNWQQNTTLGLRARVLYQF